MSNIENNIIIVGAHQPTMHAYRILKEQWQNVTIQPQPFSTEYTITSRDPVPIHILKSAQEAYYGWTPSLKKPKHHNRRYNRVNRNKNKASRKARKQTRR